MNKKLENHGNFNSPQTSSVLVQQNIINLQQLHLTPNDLAQYEKVFPGAAQQILDIVKQGIEKQATAETYVYHTNHKILSNQRHRNYLSFFLSLAGLFAGCYLLLHPASVSQIFGAILLIGVCLSVFDIKVISHLKKIIEKLKNTKSL